MNPAHKPATARREMLQRALRETSLGPRARDIFVAHPRAKEIFERLAWYLTDMPPHPAGRPLLHVAVANAFLTLQRAEQSSNVTREDRLIALYAGLFRVLPSLNEVYVEGKGNSWDPLQGEPLGDWLLANRTATVRLGAPADALAEKTPHAFRAAVATHIFDAADLADVGGRLDLVFNYPYH
ncbi:MAG TPA: hypothetical protein PLN91_00615 [Rhodanobacteraceae bacterium]|nr:hypothetical protein [Rhodanobacteraceae bacterium]